MKIQPQIIGRCLDGKKYYEIKYYDTDIKATVIGYGSFNREYVEQWLIQDFFKNNCNGGSTNMNLHDFIMSGLSEMRSNTKYCKADVMFLALGFMQRGLLDEHDAEIINGWYERPSI